MSSNPPALEVRDLSFRYQRGSAELFDGLSHRFATASITAITGASGRGKSTLLYLVGLLLKLRSGEILVDGTRVDQLPDREKSRLRSSAFGFVFQDAVLDPTRPVVDGVCEPLTYRHNALRTVRPQAHELLRMLGVAERATQLPGRVSGGQAQRVAIARALITEPQVILADEPTGNLDQDNTAGVLAALRTAAQRGTTVLVATHDPEVVAWADEVLRL